MFGMPLPVMTAQQALLLVEQESDKAQIGLDDPWHQGGIDLNTAGVKWKVGKDGKGVEMNVDWAMPRLWRDEIERIRREGIDSLTPVIYRVTPVTSVWPLLGMQPPKRREQLAGV